VTTPQIEQSLDNLISKETRLSTLALIHLLGYSEHLRPFMYKLNVLCHENSLS